jgi:hypothetical protein
MLVFGNYDEVKDHITEVDNDGFGYTVIGEPWPDETFDLESFKEMVTDWGWTGSSSSRPEWFADSP